MNQLRSHRTDCYSDNAAEVPGLNLNWDIGCHLWGFVVLFRPSNKSRDPYDD